MIILLLLSKEKFLFYIKKKIKNLKKIHKIKL